MGVHGLSTYLRENKRNISQTYQLKAAQNPSYRPIVVDGWSFIYHIQQNSGLPWVYGGEYAALAKLTVAVTQHWIAFGLAVHFVFDGPIPQLKFPTQVARSTSYVQSSILYYRTSQPSRSTAWFLRETQIIPPLALSACTAALDILRQSEPNLHVHYADEEADPYAVELAGRLGGCVVGMDSDFVVLNTAGYKGYIPLDEMVWVGSAPEEAQSDDDGDTGFSTVRKSKGKNKRIPPAEQGVFGRGVIPPEGIDMSSLTLSLTLYKPELLAAHFQLPQSLLPFLGALVGNDYSKDILRSRNLRNLFFERSASPVERLKHAAKTIRASLSSTHNQKARSSVDSVSGLIDRTVRSLLSHSIHLMGSGEISEIVDKVIEATLQYAIPPTEFEPLEPLWPSRICALHMPDTCPLFPYFSRRLISEGSAENRILIKGRKLYINAYRKGLFHPKLVDILLTGTFWPKIFLENPDAETTACSVGGPIRLCIYSLLEDALGLPEPFIREEEDEEDESQTEDSNEDELIDVVEEDSEEDDLLAPLRGALQKLHTEDETDTSDAETTSIADSSLLPPSTREITEYVRRGSHVSEERIPVPPLSTLLPRYNLPPDFSTALASTEDRLTAFLRFLDADIPEIRALPSEHTLAAVAVRWVVRVSGAQTGTWTKERWTKKEAFAFLAALSDSPEDIEPFTPPTSSLDMLPVSDRNLHLMGQVLSALGTIELLVHTLLLAEVFHNPVVAFSGYKCHKLLNESDSPSSTLVSALLEATCSGIGDLFREENKPAQKKKKKKKAGNGVHVPAHDVQAKLSASSKGLFDLLVNVEA